MISVKINGALEGYFKGASGLKQGDPLSPFLFVIAMEVLTACINQATQDTNFSYHWRTKETNTTHLVFADDVLLFCKGDSDSVRIILEAVKKFSGISGLIPNPAKCLSFFGNVPSMVQDYSITFSGFNRGNLPVHYLGLPLISGKLHSRDCDPLILRICQRIDSWTSKFISLAGRAQLIKTVIFGIQGHWAVYLFLPKGILNKIQSLLSHFLWSGKASGPCQFKVAWKTCCRSKEGGGLGFKDLHIWNQSAIVFQIWRIISKDDSLWVTWVNTYVLKRKAF